MYELMFPPPTLPTCTHMHSFNMFAGCSTLAFLLSRGCLVILQSPKRMSQEQYISKNWIPSPRDISNVGKLSNSLHNENPSFPRTILEKQGLSLETTGSPWNLKSIRRKHNFVFTVCCLSFRRMGYSRYSAKLQVCCKNNPKHY